MPDLDITADKASDMTTSDWIELSCDSCDVDFSGTVYVKTGEPYFDMDDPEMFNAHGDMPMYEPSYDDIGWPPPDNPHSIALETLAHLHSMIALIEDAELGDSQFNNQLVFSGAIVTLEAHLCNTIRNVVKSDQAALLKFATTNEMMNKENVVVTMEDLNDDRGILRQTVEDRLYSATDHYLRGILYHDLTEVVAIYELALGFDPLPAGPDRSKLFKYIKLRHDCVHRNGFDSKGNKYRVFDAGFVRNSLDTIRTTIDHVESQINPDFSFTN